MIKKFLKLFGIFLVFILLTKFIYSQGWYQVTITNSQSQATPTIAAEAIHIYGLAVIPNQNDALL